MQYNEPHKAIQRHVDEDDRMKHPITDSTGRKQDSWFINESGLYSLILSSKMPDARRFKRWVTVDRYLSEIGFSPLVGKDSFTYERDKKAEELNLLLQFPFVLVVCIS